MMNWHKFHHGHWRERMFRKGDFKYMILDLLNDKPRHGYEIIRELEGRFMGMYTPSAGIVYPTLQYLEELGYVTVEQQDGKKVHTITDDGRRFLSEQAKVMKEIKDNMKQFCGCCQQEEAPEIMREIWNLGRLCTRGVRHADKGKMEKIHKILSNAYGEIETILGH